MKFGAIALDEAAGKILAHNIVDGDGRRVFNKGRKLTADDVTRLRELGHETVIVADLAPTDLSENEAARRVGEAIAGDGIAVKAPGVGRANLMAEAIGPLVVNIPALESLNAIDPGITIATLMNHSLVQPGQLVTLVKIVPFGIPAARVADVEAVAKQHAPIIAVRPLQRQSVALVISGPDSARESLLEDFTAPTRTRIEKLCGTLDAIEYIPHEADSIASSLREQVAAGRGLILVAGISAIIDIEDVVPTALRMAGGTVSHFGVPVDPGTLLLLGYIGKIPVIGAPGCIKSPKTNVIDWVLPRLLAGERLTRADFVKMGHGGLLDDISERPMPRSE